MAVGQYRLNVDAVSEYSRLAGEDEAVARLLLQQNCIRHSIYLSVQAMEKYLRAEIFSIVDPKKEYYREKNRNHSVEAAVDFLLEVMSAARVDERIRQQMARQLKQFVTEDIKFSQLHNNLRYPVYEERRRCYSCLSVSRDDAAYILAKLDWLKKFLLDLQKAKDLYR